MWSYGTQFILHGFANVELLNKVLDCSLVNTLAGTGKCLQRLVGICPLTLTTEKEYNTDIKLGEGVIRRHDFGQVTRSAT